MVSYLTQGIGSSLPGAVISNVQPFLYHSYCSKWQSPSCKCTTYMLTLQTDKYSGDSYVLSNYGLGG